MTAPVIFKLAGSLLILSAGAACGGCLNKAEKERLLLIDSIISLLRFIRNQIDVYCVPVKEIFARCDPSLLKACGAYEPPDSFADFLKEISPKLDSKVNSVLVSFSSELGESYREEQLRSCDHHIAALAELKAVYTKDLEKRKKLNRVLPFSAAAAIVILLI